MKKFFLISIFILIFSNLFSQSKSDKYQIDSKKSAVTYEMYHPLHTWQGKNKEVHSLMLVNPDNQVINKVVVKLKVADFDSQNANRDSHMIDVTEALKYPYITFVTTNIEDKDGNLKITGKLTFHGVTKVISFSAKKIIDDDSINVIGEFEVKVTDFNIKLPSLMGVPIKDKIHLFINVTYVKQK